MDLSSLQKNREVRSKTKIFLYNENETELSVSSPLGLASVGDPEAKLF